MLHHREPTIDYLPILIKKLKNPDNARACFEVAQEEFSDGRHEVAASMLHDLAKAKDVVAAFEQAVSLNQREMRSKQRLFFSSPQNLDYKNTVSCFKLSKMIFHEVMGLLGFAEEDLAKEYLPNKNRMNGKIGISEDCGDDFDALIQSIALHKRLSEKKEASSTKRYNKIFSKSKNGSVTHLSYNHDSLINLVQTIKEDMKNKKKLIRKIEALDGYSKDTRKNGVDQSRVTLQS